MEKGDNVKTKGKLWIVIAGMVSLIMMVAFAQAEEMHDYIRMTSAREMTAQELGLAENALIPVYAAPSEQAYRGANGKAAVSLKEPVRVLGKTLDDVWLLIEYDVSKTAHRVGWIRIKEDAKKVTYPSNSAWLRSWDDLWESYQEESEDELPYYLHTLITTAPVVIKETANLTDDPRGERRTLGKVRAGEKMGAFFETKVDGKSWVYLLSQADGKQACGFVPGDAIEWKKGYHLEGDRLIVEEGVQVFGEFMDVLDASGIEYKNGGPLLNAVSFGMIRAAIVDYDTYYWSESGFTGKIREVILPSTIRYMGDDAIAFIHTERLVIPEGVERLCGRCVMTSDKIGTLVLPSTLWDFEACILDSSIGAYEVAETSPYFKAVDGVLFSKDGKTLIAYPSARQAEHYDVPKGTESIAHYAFFDYRDYDEENPIPLKSLSLPIGLKKIGRHSLTGLNELVSLVIPLTVTYLDPYAFGAMSSLEQLSMPEHLKNDFYWEWKQERDADGYNGDNGDLVQKEIEW